MNKNLLTFLVCLSLTSSIYGASPWKCACNFFKPSPDKIVNCVPSQNIQLIKDVSIGDTINIKTKKIDFTGKVVKISFKNIFLSSESKNIAFKLKQVLEINTIEPALQSPPFAPRDSSHRIQNFIGAKVLEKGFFQDNTEIAKELESLKSMNKESAEEYLRTISSRIEKQLYRKYSTTNIGFHFNLNGGVAVDYVQGGGIRGSQGADIGVQFGDRSAEIREQSYFFESKSIGFYEIINMGNMKRIRSNSGRMGNVVNIFNLDHQIFNNGITTGAIKKSNIAFTFRPGWLAKQPYNQRKDSLRSLGIPYETFIMPTLDIFQYRSWGYKKLSREQENLIFLRQIEFNLNNSSF